MLENIDDLGGDTPVWHGVLDPSLLNDHAVAAGHRLADAAKAGHWSTVMRLLDKPGHPVTVNQWRPGGPAWFTPLHQAAWHGAPTEVAAELVNRGALRSLRDARGRNAHEIRLARDAAGDTANTVVAQHKSSVILRNSYLRPPPSPLERARIQALDVQLTNVIDGRIRGTLFKGRDLRRVLRYPPVGILHELPGQHVWFPVPGMYGGFHITLRQGYLDVRSWCRIVGGSGQAHMVTHEGSVLVDEGFA